MYWNMLPVAVAVIMFIGASHSDEYHCGQRHSRVKRIVGGSTTESDEYPWMIYLRRYERESRTLTMCGATIIGRRWLLTSAHCLNIKRTNVQRAYARIHNMLFRTKDRVLGLNISALIIHPQFQASNRHSELNMADIALIKLREPLEYSERVQPICLPSNDNQIVDGVTVGHVAGWGRTRSPLNVFETFHTRKADVLKHVQRPIHVCHRNPFIVTVFGEEMSKQHLLTYDTGGSAPCEGDCGGPLMWRSSDKLDTAGNWFQYGVISRGYSLSNKDSCGAPDGVSFYTRVSLYCDFIAKHTEREVTCIDPA